MITKLKILLDSRAANYSNDLLELMLEEASEEILAYTNRAVLTPVLQRIVTRMVVLRLNQLGSEGISSQNFSGVSESYIDGLPNELKNTLDSQRKIKAFY